MAGGGRWTQAGRPGGVGELYELRELPGFGVFPLDRDLHVGKALAGHKLGFAGQGIGRRGQRKIHHDLDAQGRQTANILPGKLAG